MKTHFFYFPVYTSWQIGTDIIEQTFNAEITLIWLTMKKNYFHEFSASEYAIYQANLEHSVG
jgi:hypothetical protein